MLNLMYYFTVGKDEVRSWTIKKNIKANIKLNNLIDKIRCVDLFSNLSLDDDPMN